MQWQEFRSNSPDLVEIACGNSQVFWPNNSVYETNRKFQASLVLQQSSQPLRGFVDLEPFGVTHPGFHQGNSSLSQLPGRQGWYLGGLQYGCFPHTSRVELSRSLDCPASKIAIVIV
jgi:hypothetical protein